MYRDISRKIRLIEGADIHVLTIALICFGVFLIYLVRESRLIRSARHSIPLRIAVTGTRGKSSVVRLISRVLSGSGLRVIAKITGTKPVFILPDGSEKKIPRRGMPTVLEGKRFLKKAVAQGANTLVGEMMSIQPETLYVESQQILHPRILVITNVRRDHMESLGQNNLDIACSYSAAIPESGVLIVPEEEHFPVFEKEARQRNTQVIRVPGDLLEQGEEKGLFSTRLGFKSNIRLALAVSDFLKIERNMAWDLLCRKSSSMEDLQIHLITSPHKSQKVYTLNAFSANDPDSTKIILSRFKLRNPFKDLPWMGILNLRKDRGDRTRQWLEAFKAGFFPEIKKLLLTGEQASAVKKRLSTRFGEDDIRIAHFQDPFRMMELVFDMNNKDSMIIGMGNMGGMGEMISEHWDSVGEPYGV